MLRLSNNPMTPCRYSMFAAEQSPLALAWMASLALAAGKKGDAQAWMVELISAMVFVQNARARAALCDRVPRDIADRS